jgi:hypothetical protein
MVLDHSTRRVYRLRDLTEGHAIEPGCHNCGSGKVNTTDKLYLFTCGLALQTA